MGFVVVLVFFMLVFTSMCIKIVPEYKRLVVFTYGRVEKFLKGPGVVICIPFVQKTVTVDIAAVSLEENEQMEIVEVSGTMLKIKKFPSGKTISLEFKN